MLLRNLDLMAQNKFNVFHWHMVDSESFPYDSTTFPNLAAKGAYTPKHIYRQADVKRVVDFARLRGIRVVVEFDTPGHTGAWGLGQPGLLSDCFTSSGSPTLPNLIDPTKNETYTFLAALFQEVLNVFPDNYIHLGGDEVGGTAIDCWLNNPRILKFMKDNGFGNDTTLLENYYFKRLLPIIQNIGSHKKPIVWQEVLDNKVVAPGVIAHVWKGDTYDDMLTEMEAVTKAGHYAIMSSCWYLNYIKYGNDWGYVDYPLKINRGMYYECDPTGFKGTDEQKQRVLGGEAIMFGEYVDATNLIPRLWPRASAVGERLWSDPAQTVSPDVAWPRLHEFRCRMMRRGYPVEPPNLPTYCPSPFEADYEFDE
uniref:Beta-hexosaminidase A n=1 Tax=Plectus sambesii TaxID=2011161 RepID=A0A914VJP8_9BILA